MGVLEWSPDQFWTSTPRELTAALDGWQEKNGNRKNTSTASGMSMKRLKQLMRENPDGEC